MNSEALERLLIDQDAGELSPDVEELLENHLRQDLSARKAASELRETLRLARLAFGTQPAVTPSVRRLPFKLNSLAWRVAACLVALGLIGTWAILHSKGAPAGMHGAGPELAAAPTVDRSAFWSASRAQVALSSPRASGATRVLWKSPVRKPEFN